METKRLLLLPLPLNAPQGLSSLYGIMYTECDEHFNPLGKSELLTLRSLDYCMPSPGYLYAQHIDPYTLDEGVSEEEFLNRIEHLFNEDTIIYTWSLGNLKILNQLCQRNLREDLLITRPRCIVDLNLCLKVHELFKEGDCSRSSNLERLGKKYKLSDDLNNQDILHKLMLLKTMAQYLNSVNPHLLAYMSRDLCLHKKEIEKALLENKYLFELNLHDECTEILKPLALEHNTLTALCFDGGQVLKKVYDLYDYTLLAPSGVLTLERQRLLNLDLLDAKSYLLNVPPQQPTVLHERRPRSFECFTKEERDFIRKLRTEGVHEAFFLEQSSAKFRKYLLLYYGANHQKLLSDLDLKSYYALCKQYLEKQLPRYFNELNTLYGMSADPNRGALLEKIRHYPLERSL